MAAAAWMSLELFDLLRSGLQQPLAGEQHQITHLIHNHGCVYRSELLQVLRWARQQQPPCPWWSLALLPITSPIYGCIEPQLHVMTDRMWMFLAHNNAPLPAAFVVRADDAEKRLTADSLALRRVLPTAVPDEVLETILAMSIE